MALTALPTLTEQKIIATEQNFNIQEETIVVINRTSPKKESRKEVAVEIFSNVLDALLVDSKFSQSVDTIRKTNLEKFRIAQANNPEPKSRQYALMATLAAGTVIFGMYAISKYFFEFNSPSIG